MNDAVNHPDHYSQGDIECIDAIRAALTAEEFRGFCKGNVLKYVWRERHKGQNETLAKCIPYLNWAIDYLRAALAEPEPPSLKALALAALNEADQGLNESEWQQRSDTIRRALEALDD